MAKKQHLTFPGQYELNLNPLSYVNQPQAIIYANQKLKLNSSRIIRATLIQQSQQLYKLEDQHVVFPINELAELIGVKPNYLYEHIDEITDDISKNPIEFKDKDKQKKAIIPWVEFCVYDKEQGGLCIKLNNQLARVYEKSIINQQYMLSDFLVLRTVYAQRLYEMLAPNSLTNETERELIIDIKQLKIALNLIDMDTGAEKYSTWTKLNTRIIKPSVDEINKNTNFHIEYEPLTGDQGKKYVKIKFKISMKKK